MLVLKSIIFLSLMAADNYAGEFQNLGVGARICAMGNTGIAQGEDPSVISLNPACSASLTRSFVLMHAENFSGIVKNEFGSVVIPKDNSAFGLGLQAIIVNNIKLTSLLNDSLPLGPDNPPIVDDTVSTKDVIFYLNASQSKGLFAYGANLKVYYRDLYVLNGFGGGFDIGLKIILNNLNFGFAIRDFILAPIVWDNKSRESIFPQFSIGLAPQIPLPRMNSFFTLESDLIKKFAERGFELNTGLEYRYKGIIAGRIGKTNARYTFGAGLRYRKLNFDYAFLTHKDLGHSNKLSLKLEF
ncbi:MAG: hypothetical protein ABIL70_02830 [candidate division WOR-3 bacterium]